MVDVSVPSIATASPNAGDKVLGTTGGLVRNFPVGTGNGLAREVDLANSADEAKGSALVGFLPEGTGATGRSALSKMRESVSVMDFGAIGDGVNDDTLSIQAAIDFVAGAYSSGEVVIPNGIFVFTTITVKTGVTLRGIGGSLKLKDNTCVDGGASYYLVHNIGHSRSRFIDLVIDGNSANNSSFLVADGITCANEMSEVRGCRVTNPPDSGIMFSVAPESHCVGNVVINPRDVGIYVNGNNSATYDGIHSSIVSNNIVSGARYGGIAVKRASGYLVINSNAINDCGNGITIEDFGAGIHPSSCIISNNMCRLVGTSYVEDATVQKSGITASRGKNITVTSNQVHDCEGFGFYGNDLENFIISGNVFSGNISGTYTHSSGHNGVNIEEGESSANMYCGVSDNTISGFRNRSISITAMQNGTVTGNRCIGDVVLGVTSGAAHQGIVLVNGSTHLSTRNTISGNVVKDYKSNGINLAGLSESVVSGNRSDTSLATSSPALRVGSLAISNSIVGNVVKGDSTSTDINYTSGSSSNLFDKNILLSFSGAGRYTRVNTGISTPVSVVTPRWEGEQYITTSGGTKIWQSYGLTTSDWLQIG